MHMANELLSPVVAAGSFAVGCGAVGFICYRARQFVTTDKFALMGIMGAFVFAAQMVNFPLPLPGASGHIVGAVLLAIILGPLPGSIVLCSVVIIQCLIFQDGGLLALGCNVINLAIVPTFVGYYVYSLVLGRERSRRRMYVAAIAACTVGLVAGAVLVAIEVGLSGVLLVPVRTFMSTMIGVHLIIGVIEGLITAGVVLYLRQLRPDIVDGLAVEVTSARKSLFYVSLIAGTIFVGAGLSLIADDNPDGLEWSYLERPGQVDFRPVVSNDSSVVDAVDEMQADYTLLPDYSVNSEDAGAGWTSFAAVAGSVMTMLVVWVAGWVIKKRDGTCHASCSH